MTADRAAKLSETLADVAAARIVDETRSSRSRTMREAIDRWLDPIMRAVEERDDINVQALFDAAITVTKLERPRKWWRPSPAGDEEERTVDWVRFGQLLREALGWDDYPEWPEGTGGA